MAFADFFRRSSRHDDAAASLYRTLVEKARDPLFYSALAVPDTVNGRFDMLVIHTMLVLRRLRGEGRPADRVGRALLELLFRDMDQSLREMGVGDMGVGRHIKRMVKALFGRAEAYEAGLDNADPALLIATLKENLYRETGADDAVLMRMAGYIRRAATHMQPQSVSDIVGGQINLAVPALTQEQRHAG